jgi:RNA polymerase sigma-B factor
VTGLSRQAVNLMYVRDRSPLVGAANPAATSGLPCGEEDSLFAALRSPQSNRRDSAGEVLARRYAWIVRSAVARYAGRGETRADLEQVGLLGLVKAMRGFDPARGVPFPAYAVPTVTGEIRRHFRDRRRLVQIPRAVQDLQLLLNGARDSLTQQLGREPERAELAEVVGSSPAAVDAALGAFGLFTPLSLDEPLPPGRPVRARRDLFGVDDTHLERVLDLVVLEPLIADLAEQDRRILAMRFYDDLPQARIGAALGVSQMQVSRSLARTLAHLRDALAAA